jgi:tetratricopeptide (TPR) repeat protein
MNMYRATRVPGGSYYVHRTTWEDEAAQGIVTGAASAAGWAIGAGISGLVNLAHHTQDRRFVRAIKTLEDAYEADDDDNLLTLATDFTRRYPDIAPGHFIYAEAFERKGQFETALQALDRAEQLGMDDGQVHFMRAIIYGEMEVYGTAIQEVTYALNGSMARSYPNIRAEILLTRVIMLSQWINDYAMALRDANEAIALMPQSEGYRIRGDVYRQSGDLNKCLEDYTRAIQLSPNDPDLRERRADVYEEVGRQKEAAADRTEAAKISAAAEVQPAEMPQQSTAAADRAEAAEMRQQPTGRPPRDPRFGNHPLATPALICAFIVPPLGLILGLIALIRITKTGEGGHGRAVAAVAISIIWVVFGLIALAPLSTPSQITTSPGPAPGTPVSPPTEPKSPPNEPQSAQKASGSSATFKYFKVTVSRIAQEGSTVSVQAKVCVRKLPPDPQGDRTRISWDPWSIRTNSGTLHPKPSGSSRSGLYPRDETYRVGECASGWIPFRTNSAGLKVRYANGVGNVAIWSADNLDKKPQISPRV